MPQQARFRLAACVAAALWAVMGVAVVVVGVGTGVVGVGTGVVVVATTCSAAAVAVVVGLVTTSPGDILRLRASYLQHA